MKDEVRIVRARAPVRVDFAGGWTDVAAFADREGGVVVNAALALYVHAEAALGRRKTIFLQAEDLEQHATFMTPAELRYDGALDLHKAALNMLPVTGGIELLTRADVPKGSGLGASGALDVALLAALARAREEDYDAVELAEMAYLLETGELGLAGGRQDQYAAALGGCHEFHFSADGVEVRPIPMSREQVLELAGTLVVAYTGESHFSAQTHRRVWTAFAEDRPPVTDALRAIREVARAAAVALRAGDWRELGRLVDENWREQQRLDATIATPGVRRIEEVLRSAGAWGVKATGAGAGGCLLAVVPAARREAVAAAAEAAGATVLPSRIDADGVGVTEEVDAGRPGA